MVCVSASVGGETTSRTPDGVTLVKMQKIDQHGRPNAALSTMTSTVIGLALLGMAIAPAAVRADAVDNYIAAKMAEKSIPGLALAVIRDGHVIKEKAYGYANLELKAPVTLQTSFPWASTTKIFTAVALMQMVEQGKITLDQPVSTIVSGLPEDATSRRQVPDAP